MLSKKQYLLTLLSAVIVFFIMFVSMALYFSKGNWTGRTREVIEETKLQKEMTKPKEEVILPQTKITLKIKDRTTNKEMKTTVDAASLLGLNKEELADRFNDYCIETFSEKEVCLTKSVTSEVAYEQPKVYVLGVEDEMVCIKEKESAVRPVKIDYGIKHLSSYVYSLLLNEEIEITKEQKEALLLNPNGLQKILQDYVGE